MSSESKKLFQRRRGERPSRQAGHEKKRNDNETKTTKKKEGVDVDQQQRQKTEMQGASTKRVARRKMLLLEAKEVDM